MITHSQMSCDVDVIQECDLVDSTRIVAVFSVYTSDRPNLLVIANIGLHL